MARQPISTVPVCSVSEAPCRSDRGESASTRTIASRRRVEDSVPGGASTSPRATSSFSTPVTLTARRPPGDATSTFRPCCWSPRTRTVRPCGTISSSSPTDRTPSTSVPVNTVPNPLMVKARSMGSRARPRSTLSFAPARMPSRAASSSSRPCRVTAETGTMRAPDSTDFSSVETTSDVTICCQSASTRSIFVSATNPDGTSSRSMICRCSSVCGRTPSSAATTRITASSPCTPASMLRMKRAWPGTSTTPTSRPLGSSRWAKPRSMVIPRRFSSASRSGSMPVSAVISVDLP